MQKVIFDTDPGVDDALALLYLARHPGIDLVGITTVFGNAPLEITTRNARFLAQSWGIGAPVHAGAARPLVPQPHDEIFPIHIHGTNGLGEYPVDAAPVPEPQSAAAFLIDTIRAHPGEIRILAVGRMTNLALALALAPDIAELAKDVVIMGGAFDVNGNISPAAEANIFGDAEAADAVFGADWPVTAIPLDLTTRTLMTAADLDRLAAPEDAAMQMVRALSQDYIRFYRDAGAAGMMVHDCSAAVFLTDPELFTLRTGPVRVIAGGLAHGQTIQAPDAQGFPPSAWDNRPSQAAATRGEAEAIVARIARICAPGV